MDWIMAKLETHWPWLSTAGASVVAGGGWVWRAWWKDRASRLRRLRAVEEATIEFARQTASKERECLQHKTTLENIERDISVLSKTVGETREMVMFIKGKMEGPAHG